MASRYSQSEEALSEELSRPRRRTFTWTLSVLLAFATGAAVDQTVEVATTPIFAVGRGSITAEVVRAFYGEANRVLHSGDTSALDRVVAPVFADHAIPSGLSPDRAGLGRLLTAIRASSPEVWLSVDELVAVGDLAMARVTLHDGGRREFLGGQVPGVSLAWGTTDIFRVVGGRVVERWSNLTQMVLLEPVGEIDLGTRLHANMGITLERVVIEAGTLVTPRIAESRLLLVQHGRLTLSVDRVSGESTPLVHSSESVRDSASVVAVGTEVHLAAGDLVALPSSAGYELRNDGPLPATVIVVANYMPDAPHRATRRSDPTYQDAGSPWPAGSAAQTLAGGQVTGMPQESAAGRFGRMTLPPGGELTAYTAPGPLLLVVESGSVEIEAAGGPAWIRDGALGTVRTAVAGPLNAGDGALVPAGRAISFANSGEAPAVITLVTIAAARKT